MRQFDVLIVRARDVEKKVDALTVRERALLGITVLALFVALWYVLLMEPLEKQAAQKQAQLADLQNRARVANETLQQQIIEITGGSAEQRARMARLTRQIEEINTTLGNYAAELIDPAEMAQVLEGVLRHQQALELVRIRNLPPESLAVSEEQDAMRFYRHGLEIEVEGSYAATLEYLDAIEALPWRLYWQVLELEVIDYPQNRVRIEVSTLSLDEEWIGA